MLIFANFANVSGFNISVMWKLFSRVLSVSSCLITGVLKKLKFYGMAGTTFIVDQGHWKSRSSKVVFENSSIVKILSRKVQNVQLSNYF